MPPEFNRKVLMILSPRTIELLDNEFSFALFPDPGEMPQANPPSEELLEALQRDLIAEGINQSVDVEHVLALLVPVLVEVGPVVSNLVAAIAAAVAKAPQQ
jgi:hypothetical protein